MIKAVLGVEGYNNLMNLEPILKVIEEKAECSGLCKKQPTYVLAGLDKGPPPADCVDSVQYFLAQQLNNFRIPFIIFWVLSFFTFILTLGNCCQGRKKREDDIVVYKMIMAEYQ